MLIYPDSAEARERAAEVVAAGKIVAFRTDTFYGLGVDPFRPSALRALNALKGRDDKPILVLASDLHVIDRLTAERSAGFDALRARLWPGAVTLVVAARAEVSELLTAGTGTIGVRLPADVDARAVVRACGGVLTATSANPSGQTPARVASEVARYFSEGLGMILDGGAARSELPSTVLDISGPRPRLIREGVVGRAEIEATLRAAGAGSLS